MAIVQFPPLPAAAIALDLESDGLDPDLRAVSQLKDRVEFGGPLVTPIDKEYRPEDADLQAFIRGQAGKLRFVLAHMSINFPPTQPPPLSTAEVHVTLDDDNQTGQTVAYSMFPTQAGSSYELTRGYSVAPNLTVGPASAIAGSVTHNTVDHGTRDYILGGPDASATPAWTIKRTPMQELAGSTRLILVIQIPVGRTGSLSIDLSATIEEGRWRKRRIPLPGAPEANPRVLTF